MTKPLLFAEFTKDQFPVRVTMYRDDEVAWEAEMAGPGPLDVPALGSITRCLIQCADGTVCDSARPLDDTPTEG